MEHPVACGWNCFLINFKTQPHSKLRSERGIVSSFLTYRLSLFCSMTTGTKGQSESQLWALCYLLCCCVMTDCWQFSEKKWKQFPSWPLNPLTINQPDNYLNFRPTRFRGWGEKYVKRIVDPSWHSPWLVTSSVSIAPCLMQGESAAWMFQMPAVFLFFFFIKALRETSVGLSSWSQSVEITSMHSLNPLLQSRGQVGYHRFSIYAWSALFLLHSDPRQNDNCTQIKLCFSLMETRQGCGGQV